MLRGGVAHTVGDRVAIGLVGANVAYLTHDNGPWARAATPNSWSAWLSEDMTFSAGRNCPRKIYLLPGLRHAFCSSLRGARPRPRGNGGR